MCIEIIMFNVNVVFLDTVYYVTVYSEIVSIFVARIYTYFVLVLSEFNSCDFCLNLYVARLLNWPGKFLQFWILAEWEP